MLTSLRGYVDDQGRRRGIWVAQTASGWLTESYDCSGQLLERRVVPTLVVDAAPQQFLASDLQL